MGEDLGFAASPSAVAHLSTKGHGTCQATSLQVPVLTCPCPKSWNSYGPQAAGPLAVSLIIAPTSVNSPFTKSPEITSFEHTICLLFALRII